MVGPTTFSVITQVGKEQTLFECQEASFSNSLKTPHVKATGGEEGEGEGEGEALRKSGMRKK